MTMDEIVLKFKSEFSKMKSELSDVISKFQKLDNETSKSGSNFEDLGNPLDKLQNKLKSLQSEYDNLSKKLQRTKLSVSKESLAYTDNPLEDLEKVRSNVEKEYDELIQHITNKSKELENITDEIEYGKAVDSINELNPKVSELLHNSNLLKEAIYFKKQFDGMSYDDVINSLKNYENEIDITKNKVEELSNAKPKLVPNTQEASKNLEDVGNNADKASRNIGRLKNSTTSTNKSFDKFGNSLKNVSKLFDKLGKSFSKGFENKTRELKKLALGLIGVRTAMSVLTKAVNAYLSFDSELQDSISNSWNMLGALLAPAIELVAQMFALATNYIAQFVSALTGIDLVARANAKALETQAKAIEKANKAQRGLLSMDEITNLPTESNVNPASQITTDFINPGKIFNDLLDAFKNQQWHRAGEIIAEGINKGLKKINWDIIQEKAEKAGRNISTFLNGVFELDWQTLGSSIANAINTAINFAYGFVDEFEWGRLGVGIGDAITSFFKDFDFNKLADSISKFVTGVLDMIKGALVHTDEKELATSIVNFIERIDWFGIISKLVSTLITFAGKAMSFKLTLLDTAINDLQDFLIKKFKNLGNISGDKLASAFSGAFKKIFNILIDGINTAILPMRSIITGLGKIMGKDVTLNDIRIPHLATGTNEIESEGLYHLHEGEAVVPKKYNPTTGGYNDGADNKQIIDLLVSLNASMLEYAERPININMNSRKVAEATYDDLQQVGRNKNVSTVVVRS